MLKSGLYPRRRILDHKFSPGRAEKRALAEAGVSVSLHGPNDLLALHPLLFVSLEQAGGEGNDRVDLLEES